MMSTRTFILVLSALTLACKTDTIEDPARPPSETFTPAFSATIGSTPWQSAAVSAVASGDSGTFALTGADAATGGSATTLKLDLYNIAAPGTYYLGVTTPLTGGTATVTSSGAAWRTFLTGNAGTVTLTRVSATRITGTFSFTAVPASGSGTTTTVTSGAFDLPVTGAAAVSVPPTRGGTVRGTLNGAFWNAATVSLLAPVGGILSLSIANGTQEIVVTISDYQGPGTYVLGSGERRTMSVAAQNPSGGTLRWGGTNALTTGTFVVTSATASRVAGTLNITALPQIPGAPGATTMNLVTSFDVPIRTP